MVTDSLRCWAKTNRNQYNFVVMQLLFYHVAYRAVIMHSAGDLFEDSKITFFFGFFRATSVKIHKTAGKANI